MILYYDSNCPVCKSFVKLLEKQSSLDNLSFNQISDEKLLEYKEFYVQDGEKIFIGKEAINYLADFYPSIKDIFWILPPEYRKGALHKSYKMASWFRRWFLGKKDCDCPE
jgi:hypothetical protein